MEAKKPIQIVTPGLLYDDQANQDPATAPGIVTWPLFYKGGGIPWRVRSEGPETCFVGISFHYLRTNKSDLMYSSLAQAFSSEGEGFALKGDSVPRAPGAGHTAINLRAGSRRSDGRFLTNIKSALEKAHATRAAQNYAIHQRRTSRF